MTGEDSDDEPEMRYLGAEIPAEKHGLVSKILRHGEQAKILRDVADTIIETGGYDRHTVYDSRIESKREELRDLRERRESVDREIQDVEQELEELRERRESTLSTADEYRVALETLERSFRAGDLGHLDPGHPRLQDVAEEFHKTVEEVHAELQKRNPDVQEWAFEEYRRIEHLGEKFDGVDEELVTLPLDDREPLE